MVIKFSLKSVPSLSSMTPGDSVSVVKLNPRQQLSHASYTTDSWSADRQPAQIRQDQRPAATIDQHLLLHHTMAESGRQAVKWWVETGLREMGAPAGTCYAAPATLGPCTHPRLGVDVPGMVRGAVHLGGDGDQVHLEVRGVPQLDDAGDSI
jgi:hypothetical protein